MKSIYGLLDAEARTWWYYRDLRKNGQAKQARAKERESIRHNITALRGALAAGWLSIGRGGTTLHWSYDDEAVRLEGLSRNGAVAQAALRIGIPIIDSTTIPDELIRYVTALPLISTSPRDLEPPPWGGLSYAPINEVAAAYEALGATLHNFPPLTLHPENFRDALPAEKAALSCFVRGDAVGLSRAMFTMEGK